MSGLNWLLYFWTRPEVGWGSLGALACLSSCSARSLSRLSRSRRSARSLSSDSSLYSYGRCLPSSCCGRGVAATGNKPFTKIYMTSNSQSLYSSQNGPSTWAFKKSNSRFILILLILAPNQLKWPTEKTFSWNLISIWQILKETNSRTC